MERVVTPYKLGVIRKLLRTCFRNVSPTLVPTEVWWDIVLGTDVRTMPVIAQTSKGFWRLVEEIRRRNLWIALEYRRIDQIPLAKKCLKLCANHGIPEAMFHIGYAKEHGGFGFKRTTYCRKDWMQKASDAGYPLAMAITAFLPYCYTGEELIQKVFWSKDPCAIGYVCDHIRSHISDRGSVSYFKVSANAGNEFGQYYLARHYEGIDNGLAKYWHTKAAEQGHVISQYFLIGAKKSQYWEKKVKAQKFI